VIGKPIIHRASMMKMLAISLAVGTSINLLVDGKATFMAAKTLSFAAWLLLIWMGVICTAVGYTVWFIVIRECPVNVAALTIFAQTVFGIAIAALWVGEKLQWEHVFGSITIVSGLAVGLSGQVKSENQNPTRPP